MSEGEKMTGCGKCGSEDLNVNGLYYICNNCKHLDDSTFNMIMSRANKLNEGK